jgi:hypothetical protein
MQYAPFEDGEWFDPRRLTHLACCDCKLVHRVQTRRRDGRLEVAFTRDRRATAQRRRRSKANKTVAKRLRDRLSSNQEDFPLPTKPKAKKAAKARKPAAKSGGAKRSATTKRASATKGGAKRAPKG